MNGLKVCTVALRIIIGTRAVECELAIGSHPPSDGKTVAQATVVHRVTLTLVLSGNRSQVDTVLVIETGLILKRQCLFIISHPSDSATNRHADIGIPVAVHVGRLSCLHTGFLVVHHAICHLVVHTCIVEAEVEHTHAFVPVVVPYGVQMIVTAVFQVGIAQSDIQRVTVVTVVDERQHVGSRCVDICIQSDKQQSIFVGLTIVNTQRRIEKQVVLVYSRLALTEVVHVSFHPGQWQRKCKQQVARCREKHTLCNFFFVLNGLPSKVGRHLVDEAAAVVVVAVGIVDDVAHHIASRGQHVERCTVIPGQPVQSVEHAFVAVILVSKTIVETYAMPAQRIVVAGRHIDVGAV